MGGRGKYKTEKINSTYHNFSFFKLRWKNSFESKNQLKLRLWSGVVSRKYFAQSKIISRLAKSDGVDRL